jgi:hypothetical protein
MPRSIERTGTGSSFWWSAAMSSSRWLGAITSTSVGRNAV